MSKNIQLSLLLVALLSSANATETIELKPLSITSTAIQTNELQSTDAVEVYTSQDIENARVQNVYEFLTKNSSITATSAYGNKFMQKIDMRGYGIGDGYQNIVITVNGRRLNNVDMVPQLLGSISPSSIESIEIIKSSGIVLGGDGANAGVINIRTKKDNTREISIYGGSDNLLNGSLYLGHSDDKLSVSLSAQKQTSKVIRELNTNSPKDENTLATGSFNLEYLVNDKLDLRFGVAATNTDAIYAGNLTKAQYDNDPKQEGSSTTIQEYDTQSIELGASYYLNDELTINADVYKENKESEYNYVTYSSISKAKYDYKSAKTNIDYAGQNLSAKVGYDFYDSTRTTSKNSVTKNANAIYAMSQYKFSKNVIKAGLRYEQVDFQSVGGANQKDNLWGGELGFNASLSSNASIYFNYAHTYQSADLDRLFSYSTGVFNGYVKPSQANNFSLGFNHITPSNKFKVSAYYTDLKNEIYYYADPTFTNSRNTNINKSHKYGLDIYDKWLISDNFNFLVNYNYVQAIIDEEIEDGNNYANKDLPGVSDHNVKVSLSYLPTPQTTLTLHQIYRSEAYAANDFNNNFTQKQEAFKSTDFSATYVTKSWEVFAKINNLFNQKNGIWIKDNNIYPVNFTTTAMAGLKVKF